MDQYSSRIENLVTVSNRKGKSQQASFDKYIADADDVDGLRLMAARAKVVLNCAGPFAQYGNNVVAACAELGTDYVDITGEFSWVGEMRSQHGAAAAASGARIIPMCGFDSIPSDLSIFVAVQALVAKSERNKGSAVQIDRATTFHSLVGSVNGGTLHTMLDFPVDMRECFSHPVPYMVDDPLVLAPPKIREDPKHQKTRNRFALCEWLNLLPFTHSLFMEAFRCPALCLLPMPRLCSRPHWPWIMDPFLFTTSDFYPWVSETLGLQNLVPYSSCVDTVGLIACFYTAQASCCWQKAGRLVVATGYRHVG